MSKYKNFKTPYVFSGKLIYNSEAKYELHFSNGYTNISNILDNIFNFNNKYIEIKIMNCCKLIFEEKGNLMKYKSYDFGIIDYHINGNCLGNVLFNNTGESLEIIIFAEGFQYQGDRYVYDTKQTTNQAK